MCKLVSRREALAYLGAGVAVAGIGVPLDQLAAQAARDAESAPRWFFLMDREAAFLSAACDRIIPADAWPSASEAGVVDYIDLQLATDWGHGAGLYLEPPFAAGKSSQGYQVGLTPAQLYREAIAEIDNRIGGDGFAGLSPSDMDGVLTQLEEGDAELGSIPGSVFFDILHQNTVEGYFADPIYNGNRNLAGWRMVGFPGAHAYYITEVGRHGLDYFRPPQGIAWQPGSGPVRPFTGRRQALAPGG